MRFWMMKMMGAVVALGATMSQGQTVGGLVMGGDKAFDGDSILNADSNQWRWLSYPGSRLSVNPSQGADFAGFDKRWETRPFGAALPLDLGAFSGPRAVRLMDLVTVGLSAPGGAMEYSETRSTTWYPYKLTCEAGFPGGARVRVTDFFTEARDGVMRILEVSGARGKVLRLQGVAARHAAVRWDAAAGVLRLSHPAYECAIAVVRLDGSEQKPVAIAQIPKVKVAKWTLDLPIEGDHAGWAVSIGFASEVEGAAKAAERAAVGLARPAGQVLAATKAFTDAYLRKVPAPKVWGLHDSLGDVAPAHHRRAYYAAWAFLAQNVIGVYPESRDYPYPQIAAGKPALWNEGEKSSPATCGWESFFAYQRYAFIDPELSWQAYMGLMTRVSAEGVLGGESLPSRKAQTAWFLHQRKPDVERLRTVYPALKRYLLWREANPRWVYETNKAKDEKDIEFVVAWIDDVNYAVRIADTLGLTDEVVAWRGKQAAMVGNMRLWFFSNPARIEQFYFADSGLHATKDRSVIVPAMITTALCLHDLPDDLARRTQDFFRGKFDPAKPLIGFEIAKHPDLALTASGLIDRGMPEAKPFVTALLAAAIRAGEFTEELNMKVPSLVFGVKPSLFTPLNIIEFTWLLNDVRCESGNPAAFEWPERKER